MTDSDRPDEIPEVDVPLTRVDMEHLEAGQPVFKAGDGTRLVLRFDGWQNRSMVPIGVLEDLVEEMERYQDTDVDKFASRLTEVIKDYTDE